MEKEVRERSSKSKTQASPPKPAMITESGECRSRRRLVSDLKHSSFAANLSAVANQEVEDDGESLPTEDPYEQAITESLSTSLEMLVLSNAASLAVFREVSKEMVVAPDESLQQRGKTAPLKLVKEVKPISRDVSDGCREDKCFKKKYVRKKSNKPIEQAASYHQKREVMMQHRDKAMTESPSTSLGNYDLLVLSNAASLAVFREASKEVVVAPEESLQQKGKAARLKLVKQVKPINRDFSDGCREDKWFEKKYVRKKSKNTKIKTVEGQYRDSGIKDKTKINIQSRDENQEIARKNRLIPYIFGIKNQEIPKRKRSQRKRKPGSSLGRRRKEKERDCDQVGSNAGDSEIAPDEDDDADKLEEEEEEENTVCEADLNQIVLESDIGDEEMIVSGSEGCLSLLEEAETEDVSDASSCKWWRFTTRPRTSRGIRHVQWSNKTKRNCMTLDRRNVEQPQDPSSRC